MVCDRHPAAISSVPDANLFKAENPKRQKVLKYWIFRAKINFQQFPQLPH
jgi:hypothetical protein